MNLNLPTPTGDHLCPCCGLPGYFTGRSYIDEGHGVIGTGICPACLFEPGFDDDPAASADALPTVLASIRHYRAKWIDAGMPWRGKDDYWFTKPTDWNPAAQLDALFALEPDIE